MKGIILAGGSGTRLQPMTHAISKQVLPVYDKPMIYYPLSVLMNFGLRDILIISTPRDLPIIENFLGDGSQLGLRLSYKIQNEPRGIAEAFILGKEFIGRDSVCLILGDNIFHGNELSEENLSPQIAKALNLTEGAHVVAYRVRDPQRYGVVELSKDNKIAISIEEKPEVPKSNWAVTGLYFYDNNVVEYAENLKPSARGEIEITDINRQYLAGSKLHVVCMGRGFAWLDAGTPDALLESAQFVQTVEQRQGIKIACIEEIALRRGFMDKEKFRRQMESYSHSSDYYKYLETVLSEV
jgi:glucose-1-phosphate thymidylyltransferase